MILHTKTLQVAIKTGHHEAIIQALYTSNGKKSQLFPLKNRRMRLKLSNTPFVSKKGKQNIMKYEFDYYLTTAPYSLIAYKKY